LTPFHCTIEHGRKLLPATLTLTSVVPAVPLDGESVATVGAGSDEAAVTEKLAETEVTAPVDTVMVADPWEAMSDAGMAAVSCVAPINVVARGDPFQLTTEPLTKFAPFTASTTPVGLQDGVEAEEVVDDESEAMDGGRTGKAIPPAVPPPGPSVNKEI
jgi:hypothetical protein